MGTHWALAETGGREVKGSSLLLYEKSCQAQVGGEKDFLLHHSSDHRDCSEFCSD